MFTPLSYQVYAMQNQSENEGALMSQMTRMNIGQAPTQQPFDMSGMMRDRRFYRTSSEIVEEIILFQTTILSHTVLHSPDKYSQATNVQTSDIVCNKQLEIGCHEHCSSAI